MMVEWLFKGRPIIEQTIMDLKWKTFVNTLCGTHHQKNRHQGEICSSQHKEGLVLGHVCNFVDMVELVLMALKAFNGKQPFMGKAWFV
jgi:hypothetical protein